jgi:uncharacterized protein YjlB
MVLVKTYHLPPTALIPNSPHPLLHYPGLLTSPSTTSSDDPTTPIRPATIHETFHTNGWRTQWIFRYGPTQRSHYHSRAHEVMAVLSGSATIRFGVADTVEDMDANTHGSAEEGWERGGIEVHAERGDVFVLPAGTAHKTYDTQPRAEFALLTEGDGHRIVREGELGEGDVEGYYEVVRRKLEGVKLDGFTMLGAYPVEGGEWDFQKGGEDEGAYEVSVVHCLGCEVGRTLAD